MYRYNKYIYDLFLHSKYVPNTSEKLWPQFLFSNSSTLGKQFTVQWAKNPGKCAILNQAENLNTTPWFFLKPQLNSYFYLNRKYWVFIALFILFK